MANQHTIIEFTDDEVMDIIDTTQYDKIKWVNKNVLPVEIVVVDKRNNNLIKRKLL